MRKGVIHRLDAAVVAVEVDDAVRAAHPRLPGLVELALERSDEGSEHIQHQRAALGDDGAHLRIDAGVHHDRAHAIPFACFAYALDGLARCVHVGDESDAIGEELEAVELREQAVADGLRRDTGTIRYVENRAYYIHACAISRIRIE